MNKNIINLTSIIIVTLLVLLFSGCPSGLAVEPSPAQISSYMVTFDSQQATTPASPESLSIPQDTAINNFPIEPKNLGLEFGGWFTKPNGEGIKYSTLEIIESDITLYAYWIDQRLFTPIKDINDSIVSYEVSAKDPATFLGDLVIPSEYMGKPVNIAVAGFKGIAGLKSVTFSNTMHIIPEEAFANSGLTGSLVIPSNITTIGNRAFESCENLNGSLKLNEGLENIGNSAFKNCRFLTGELIIPSSVITLGSNAFFNCDGFDKLTIRSGIKTIGYQSFYECDGFKGDLVIPDSVETIEHMAFYQSRGFDGSIIMSNSIKIIGDRAFSQCAAFTGELILPEGLESIGLQAFRNNSLTKISVPSTVTEIMSGAFGFLGKGPDTPDYIGPLVDVEMILNFSDASIAATDIFEFSYIFDVKIPTGSKTSFENRGFTYSRTTLNFVEN